MPRGKRHQSLPPDVTAEEDRPLTMTALLATLKEANRETNAKIEALRNESRKDLMEMFRELRKESQPVYTTPQTVTLTEETDFVRTENLNLKYLSERDFKLNCRSD